MSKGIGTRGGAMAQASEDSALGAGADNKEAPIQVCIAE